MKTKAYLYIITAAVCWGLIGLFVRTLAAQGFSSMQIVALRSLAAAICGINTASTRRWQEGR